MPLRQEVVTQIQQHDDGMSPANFLHQGIGLRRQRVGEQTRTPGGGQHLGLQCPFPERQKNLIDQLGGASSCSGMRQYHGQRRWAALILLLRVERDILQFHVATVFLHAVADVLSLRSAGTG